MSVVILANCVVSLLHLLLLPPARREALTVVLIRRRDGSRRLPAIVELWDVRWDVLWPAGPDRRAKAYYGPSLPVQFYFLWTGITSAWGAVVPGDVPAVSQ